MHGFVPWMSTSGWSPRSNSQLAGVIKPITAGLSMGVAAALSR
jgi:hypothetical protein